MIQHSSQVLADVVELLGSKSQTVKVTIWRSVGKFPDSVMYFLRLSKHAYGALDES